MRRTKTSKRNHKEIGWTHSRFDITPSDLKVARVWDKNKDTETANPETQVFWEKLIGDRYQDLEADRMNKFGKGKRQKK